MKNKKTLLINGYFLCRKLTGIERYAYEITIRLDQLITQNEVSIIVPKNTKNLPIFKNITVIRHGKKIQHILWQMITLQKFLLFNHSYIILDFSNTCLPFFPGIIFLHDIYCKLFPEDFSGIRDFIVRCYNCWQYRLISRKAIKICTVSNYSKNQIAQAYEIDPNRITVIHNGWNHFLTIIPDFSIFEVFPRLSNPFYFSLGSLSKRKNIQWIINYAIEHPIDLFAISGDSLPTASFSIYPEIPENIILLGYLDDSKVKALMKKCKAFILPSYYEGFGIPPLEALSCGTKIIIARASSLPEIYENTAHYIDPFDVNIDLDKLLLEPIDSPEFVLKKYSYDDSAKKVYDIIHEVITEVSN